MNRQVAVACLLGLLVVASGATLTAAQKPTTEGLLGQPEGFDQTTFEITVTDNGSARWAIKHHRRLANESEVQQFREFARTFENNETELYRNFVSRAGALTDVGRNATGRPMEATAFGREAYTNVTASFDDRGTIELQFTWTHFARTADDRIVVGDVFGENFYIGPDQALVFVPGNGVTFADVDPMPTSQSDPDALSDSNSITWIGERTFTNQRPYVEFVPRPTATSTRSPGPADGDTTTDDASSTPPSDATTQTNATTEPLGSGTSNPMVWLVGVLIVVLGVSSAIAYRTGSVTWPSRSDDSGSETVEPSTQGTDTANENQTPIPDEELLSDNDRVVKLLEDNGGRMKQVNIVEETDWSKSKVSMLLSDMEEDGEISKLRVGRENIISLAGHEPDAAGSPFDDE